jgi:hypothetical protein
MQTMIKVEGRTWSDMHGEGLTLRVMVRSNVNTRNWTQGERPLSRNDLTSDLGGICEALGGALAERQNEMWNSALALPVRVWKR